jgi:phosphatidylglycerol:prolipoprotein diacylglycerol transferase
MFTVNPVIIQFGPLAIRWYGVMLATTIALGIYVGGRYAPRFGIPATVYDAVAVPFTIAALVGARIGFVISHYSLFDSPLEFVRIDRGGLASHGAIAAGLLYLIWASRRHGVSMWSLADAIGWAIPIGNIFVRIGNFINGELYGNPTTLPWGVRFPGAGDAPRHPLQVYEMILAGVIILVTRRVAARRRVEGQVFWTIMVLTSIGRVIFDALRSDMRAFGVFTLGQIPAVLLIVWGTVVLVSGGTRLPDAQSR